MNPQIVEMFHYWIDERLRVFHKKEEGLPKPWSEDPVFQNTYFCNVRREDDRVTRWIRETYGAYAPHHAPFNMMMARLVNKPSTLDDLKWPMFNFEDLQQRRWSHVMSKPGAWGSAYIVSTNGRAMPKHSYVLGLLQDAFELFGPWGRASLPGTLASAHKAIQAVPGFASFLAAQVIADLKNTPQHSLSKAEDWATFSAYGPGSLRGLSWYYGIKVTPSLYDEAIREAWIELGPSRQDEVVCMQNLQNCFCEFDKYMRVREGTGRSKRKYNGR